MIQENLDYIAEHGFLLKSEDNSKLIFTKTVRTLPVPSFATFNQYPHYFTTSSREGSFEYCICDLKDIKIVIYLGDPSDNFVYIKHGKKVLDLEFENIAEAQRFLQSILPQHKMSREESNEFNRKRLGIPIGGFPKPVIPPAVGQIFVPKKITERTPFEMAIITEFFNDMWHFACFRDNKIAFTISVPQQGINQFYGTDLKNFSLVDIDVTDILKNSIGDELYNREMNLLVDIFKK